jgi:hypothetical protein
MCYALYKQCMRTQHYNSLLQQYEAFVFALLLSLNSESPERGHYLTPQLTKATTGGRVRRGPPTLPPMSTQAHVQHGWSCTSPGLDERAVVASMSRQQPWRRVSCDHGGLDEWAVESELRPRHTHRGAA